MFKYFDKDFCISNEFESPLIGGWVGKFESTIGLFSVDPSIKLSIFGFWILLGGLVSIGGIDGGVWFGLLLESG